MRLESLQGPPALLAYDVLFLFDSAYLVCIAFNPMEKEVVKGFSLPDLVVRKPADIHDYEAIVNSLTVDHFAAENALTAVSKRLLVEKFPGYKMTDKSNPPSPLWGAQDYFITPVPVSAPLLANFVDNFIDSLAHKVSPDQRIIFCNSLRVSIRKPKDGMFIFTLKQEYGVV